MDKSPSMEIVLRETKNLHQEEVGARMEEPGPNSPTHDDGDRGLSVATLLLAHHLILGAELRLMPSGSTLAQADIPIVNAQADADQVQSAPSTMQPAVTHSTPDHYNEPGISVYEGTVPVPKKLAKKIWRWEFVEFSKMVAKSWSQKSDEISTGLVAGNRCRRPVTELIPCVKD